MVQELREVDHPPASFGDDLGGAQDEVVVLRPVEADAKPADLGDHLAAQHGKMAGVHRRTESFGTPIGLVEMSRLAAIGEHVSLVAVDVVDVGGGVDGRRHALQRGGHQSIVVIQQGDELALGHRQRVVRGGDDPTVG